MKDRPVSLIVRQGKISRLKSELERTRKALDQAIKLGEIACEVGSFHVWCWFRIADGAETPELYAYLKEQQGP